MNVPSVAVLHSVHCRDRSWFAVVTSGAPDGFPGSYWYLYDQDGKTVSFGESRGWSGDGAGSAISAIRLAKAAARRRDTL